MKSKILKMSEIFLMTGLISVVLLVSSIIGLYYSMNYQQESDNIESIIFTNKECFNVGDVISLSDSICGAFVLADASDWENPIVGVVVDDNGIILTSDYNEAVKRHIKLHNKKSK